MANIDSLAQSIANELQRYGSMVKEEVETAKVEAAKELVTDLKQHSPQKTGKYSKGWRSKEVGDKLVVYNTRHQLTHLLEFGHAKVNGGRVPARVHIRPAEQRMITDYTQRIERAVRS
ncbi:MAG: HK97 gp10 family phage protein [Bacillus sp. (in: firmicutes)]